jgi:pyruvate dehydrogenase E2 component (dihydrolipoamide acetyltransferase)
MPKLGMAMKKGTLKRWLTPEGGAVEKGTPLLEIMTEKINAVVPAPAAGVLGRVVAQPETELPVGGLLGLIGDASDSFPPAEELGGTAAPAPAPAAPAPPAAAPAAAPTRSDGGEVLASPAARRMARDLGIDLALVPPSTPGKRLTTDDVEAYATAPSAAPPMAEEAGPGGRLVPFTGIRKVVAERLSESLQTMAQVTISREADVSGLAERRRTLAPGFEAASGLHLTYTDLLLETTARLLLEHPALNATLTDEGIRVFDEAVHLGVAVALDDGLIVPVIRDAHSRTLLELTRARTELAAQAQAGTLGLDAIEGGTFSVTNLGAFGADSFTPIVNPPQCAILGVGRLLEKPVVVDGAVEVRPTMWLSLTFDHRLVDGAPAARFLEALAARLGAQGPAPGA